MTPLQIAIVGSGPSALMAATQVVLNSPHAEIRIFEKRKAFGRKLLIAGSSGLNISNGLEISDFAANYAGATETSWSTLLENFGPADWIKFIEETLGLPTFLGTSNRHFVKDMKGASLLKEWILFLKQKGVQFFAEKELIHFRSAEQVELQFADGSVETCDRAAFFLGGGSWEAEPPMWCENFRSQGIIVHDFEPSNVGYEIAWSDAFLKEAEGKWLKKVKFSSSRGSKLGELVVTRYGLEGTPVYTCGEVGVCHLDLKPDLSESEILQRLEKIKENLSPMRRVQRKLELGEAALAVVFHLSNADIKADLKRLTSFVKNVPLSLLRPRPLAEAISSKGGVALDELTPQFELKKYPHIFCGGEMLDWDAPTGGFLIQACISQGAAIGKFLDSVP